MDLQEIVKSSEWDEAIRLNFFQKLDHLNTTQNKIQNCIQKSLKLAASKDSYKMSEAINLMDYVIENFNKDTFSVTRAYSMKGIIYELYIRDFFKAYECYTKWSEIGGKCEGYEFDRLRSWIRATKLQPSEQLFVLIENMQKTQPHLPTRQIRFWLSIAAGITYAHTGRHDDAKQMAKTAISIFNEKDQTSLQKMFKSNNFSDKIDVLEYEMQLIWELAKNGINK